MEKVRLCPYDGGKLVKLDNNDYKCPFCDERFKEDELSSDRDRNDLMSVEIIELRNLRQEGEFYKVEGRIKEILANPKYANDSNYERNLIKLYWQALLNEHFVVYEYSMSSSEKTYFPTFYHINHHPIKESQFYNRLVNLCMKLNTLDELKSYEANIKKIENYKNLFFEIRDKHPQFNIFLSFKHLDQGIETTDTKIANTIYQKLGEMNKATFFSEVTLKKIGSEAWEPHIYYALYSASILLLICTNKKYLNDQWVKNEWSRFLYLSKTHKKSLIIILPNGFSKNDLPEPLRIDLTTGLERQFLFYQDENDLISQLFSKIEYTKTSKNQDYKELYDCEVEIKDILEQELLTLSELNVVTSFIHKQIKRLEVYYKKYQEYPMGITWVNVLEKYLQKAKSKYNRKIDVKKEEEFNQIDLKAEFNKAKELYEFKLYNEAFELFEKLANLNSTEAQFYLGKMYELGLGINKDYLKATYWYSKAATNGHTEAPTILGDLYRFGKGIKQDYQKAFEWYQLGAKLGDAKSQNMIGFFYEEGKGVPRDYQKAMEWYALAAEHGDSSGPFNLAHMYSAGRPGLAKNDRLAFKWYKMAAEYGNRVAEEFIGDYYLEGQVVPQDYHQAIEWYVKATNNGSMSAREKLKDKKLVKFMKKYVQYEQLLKQL